MIARMRLSRFWVPMLLVAAADSGTAQPYRPTPIAMQLSSPAFVHNAPIPAEHARDGGDRSPPLAWSGAPAEAEELVLIMDDPDAPRADPWVHWVAYKIPAAAKGIPAGLSKKAALDEPPMLQGSNTWNQIGYGGPLPPRGGGPHHYHFILYAVDRALPLRAGLSKDEVLRAIEGHVIARAELIGTYQR